MNNNFAWLIRRELWENRSFLVVPAALVVLLISLYALAMSSSHVSLGFDMQNMSIAEALQVYPDRMHPWFGVVAPLLAPTVLLNVALLLTWFFYLCYTLYSDRKDRSVLFWKSLPVSDTATVLSKLTVAMLVLPAITLVAIVSAAALVTVINVIAVSWSGNSAWEHVLSQVPYVSGLTGLIYGLLVQSLWYAPVFGWLMLVSAWAPRVPAVWAIMPPLALAILEPMLLGTESFARFLASRLQPVVPAAFRDSDMHDSIESGQWREAVSSLLDPAAFLSEPGLYLGLVVAGVFVAAAIWSRRYRDS